MPTVLSRAHYEEGFMLWEVMAGSAFLAITLHALMSVSLAVLTADSAHRYQHVAQQWALSIADQLASGYALSGRVVLADPLLPEGVACLSEHPPWQLLSIRWQRAGQTGLPVCHGHWLPTQQLCFSSEACE